MAARIKVSTLVPAVGLLASSAGCSELIIGGGLTSSSEPITVCLPADKAATVTIAMAIVDADVPVELERAELVDSTGLEVLGVYPDSLNDKDYLGAGNGFNPPPVTDGRGVPAGSQVAIEVGLRLVEDATGGRAAGVRVYYRQSGHRSAGSSITAPTKVVVQPHGTKCR